ncbi:ArsR/SmtB family transcription factor [Calidithermus roseus]|uniref:Helix-turn-helix domain protein n=1 Tax=Calidithermus roseus TaxID=1644118 RepID=A0A399EY64_9DEIN|nr:helix-turn-helix domain-containing protein [Calidithermus roseus]RIH87482.1 Helix-turn-helix domain protein [Calidithermus roseus]
MPTSGNRRLTVEGEAAVPVLRALDSETRMLIFSLLSHEGMNVSELAEAMGMAHSTVSTNLKMLEEAGLLVVQYVPGTRGSQKLVAKRYDEILIKLPGVAVEADQDVVEISMPIGNYHRIDVKPTCGLASDSKFIGMLDDVRSFYEPDHVFAQLLWFGQGYVEYAFPNNVPHGAVTTELELSAEICSEAPQYDNNWPSDITLWINGVEVGTWTSPGDFGGRRGNLNPAWWPEDQTQYGMLKRWKINGEGSFIDGEVLSPVKLADLRLESANHIEVRLGVKPDARNVGGMNLFGRRFGNYPQDLLMRLRYTFPEGHKALRVK